MIATSRKYKMTYNNELLSSHEEVADIVNPALATAVNKIWTVKNSDNVRKQLLEQNKRLQNYEYLIVQRCNPEIWNETISSAARSHGIKEQKILSCITAAASGITVVADQLLKLKRNKLVL